MSDEDGTCLLQQCRILSTVVDPRFKLKYVTEESQKSGVKVEPDDASSPDDNCNSVQKKTALDILLGPEENSGPITVNTELDMFLAEPIVPRKTNPLARLHKLYKKFLCTLCTSVPSEIVFSKAGLTVTKLRNSLKPKNVNAFE